MKFKEFSAWCNERAFDGCWGYNTALVCIDALQKVHEAPFWRREKVWQRINEEFKIVEGFVIPTNRKISEAFGNGDTM